MPTAFTANFSSGADRDDGKDGTIYDRLDFNMWRCLPGIHQQVVRQKVDAVPICELLEE